jgi:uncharacterized RDD family membrane protein YckC
VRLDDRVTIATPEGITIELVLAGLGSRFIARLLDTVIQIGLIITLGLGTWLVSPPGVARAGVLVLIFFVIFAYDVPFELLNSGRTIGKMTAGIRVVTVSGEPVSFLASAVRNLLRIVDFLPVFYAVGSIALVSTSRDQRLGDLAAGTVVLRDKFNVAPTMPPPLTVPANAVATWDVSALDNGDLDPIRQFLDRRLTLSWPVRAYFGTQLASRVAARVAGLPEGAHPEYVLEGVVIAKQQRA